MLVENSIACCCTGQIQGLSNQVITRLLDKGLLVKIDHPLIHCTGKQNNPYLQPQAYGDLVKAVEFRDRPLIINSCLRTVMQQYMLHVQKTKGWCGIKAASLPGQSNHQSGLSIDIEDTAGWKACLKRFNWDWIGAFDPMHFDHKSPHSKQMGKLQILEFQKLWNENCDDGDPQGYAERNRLLEDGIWGNKTALAVANSPCEGFDIEGLKKGDRGERVELLQYLLKETAGFTNLKVDSDFGAATEKAVREFQAKHNLTVNGIANKETMDLLTILPNSWENDEVKSKA